MIRAQIRRLFVSQFLLFSMKSFFISGWTA